MDVSEQAVFEQMFRHGDQRLIRSQGFSLRDMQRYLTARGLRADGFELPLQKLIDSALPAIVLVADKGYRHFVVIKGAADGRILVGDPSSGTRAMGRAAFESIWANKLLFVIHDTPAAPQFNMTADWRAAPRAPLDTGIDRSGLGMVTMSKHGAGGF
jgi:predicted double-glycine peptidase